jgi:hypothetical protein
MGFRVPSVVMLATAMMTVASRGESVCTNGKPETRLGDRYTDCIISCNKVHTACLAAHKGQSACWLERESCRVRACIYPPGSPE